MKLQGGEKEKMMYDENPISDKVRFIDNKIYTPADTTKIEKAIDLMTELENVTKSNLDTSTKQIKIMELQNQIKQTGFKLSLDELKQLETLLDRRQRDIVLQKEKNLELKSERLIQKAVTDEIINQTKYYTQMTEVEKNRIKDMVANTALVKDMQAKWKAQDGRNVFFGNNYTKFYANYVQKRIDAEEKQKQEDEEKKKKKDEEEKVQKQKEASLKNFKSSVKNSTLDFFKGNFNIGLKKQTNTFNDTFSNIAARTGTTENGYLIAQGGINARLSYRGLDSNIRASDIMKTWNTLATNGINVDLNTEKGRAEATSRAIEVAINKTVVPYLDTSSSNFQQLVDFYPSLQTQIKGIGRATTEISGSSVYANKYLQDMINNLSPMSKLAETQIGIQYAKTIGTYESLRSQGISESAIGDYYAMAKSIQNDPSKALTSGNLTQRLATANLIANSFVSSKVDLIYSIATSTAQAAAQSTNTIPVVFSAITDPESAGILKNNVTGVSDRVDIKQQLQLLLKLDSKIKKVGVIYNSSEQNSKVQVDDLKAAAKELGVEVVEKSVIQASEIPQAADALTRESDAIYLPTDNLVASVVNLLTDKATAAKKIVFGAESAHVKGGALITQGIDYYEMGKQAGKIAIDILKNGKKPSEIKYQRMSLNDIVVNGKTMAALGITLPEDIKSKAKIIN